MVWRPWFAVLSLVVCLCPLAVCVAQSAPTPRPEGTLTVAVATFGNERWLPELYPGAGAPSISAERNRLKWLMIFGAVVSCTDTTLLSGIIEPFAARA